MLTAPMRAYLGFVAGAISLMSFHQGMVELFHLLGAGAPAWSIQPVPPFHLPKLVSLAFWAGIWGMLFALLSPRFALPSWIGGIGMGIAAALFSWFVIAPFKGNPIAHDFEAFALARSLLINTFYGLGVGVILPLLQPRPLLRVQA